MQAVQSAHALAHFAAAHPTIFSEWLEKSNYLAILSIKNEESLDLLRSILERQGLRITPFYEDDLDDALTAIAIEPHPEAQRLTSSLPLALRDMEVSV